MWFSGLSAQVNEAAGGNFLAISDAQASYAIQDYNSFSLIFFKAPKWIECVSRLENQGLFKSNDYQILVYRDHMGAYCIFWLQASRDFNGVDISSGPIIHIFAASEGILYPWSMYFYQLRKK